MVNKYIFSINIISLISVILIYLLNLNKILLIVSLFIYLITNIKLEKSILRSLDRKKYNIIFYISICILIFLPTDWRIVRLVLFITISIFNYCYLYKNLKR